MTDLFRRRVEVLIGDDAEALSIKDLLIGFELERKADSTPAAGEIAIYNLNESNETRIRERGRRVRLSAGYMDGRYGLLFDGDVRRVDRERDNLNRITRIQIGGQTMRRTGAFVKIAVEPGEPIRDIFARAVKEGFPNLTLGPLDFIPADAVEEDGYTVHLKAGVVMTGILPVELRWYEDNGVIRITKRGESADDRRGENVVVVSERTGMIGSPSVTDEGIVVKTLIDHRIGLDTRLRIESAVLERAASGDAANERAIEETSGEWKVVALRHSGDNREGEFVTEAELRAIQ